MNCPKVPFSGDPNRRILIVAHVAVRLFTLGLLCILVRVVLLQNWPPDAIVKLIGSQRSTAKLHGRRGNITDRHGRVMATTSLAHRLFVDPLLIEDPATFSEHLGYSLDYDPAFIERTISRRLHSRYIVLDDDLNDARLAKVDELDLSGVATELHLVRHYPHGSLAGALIGFVGSNGHGLEGLELAFDGALTASDGELRYVRDIRRRPIWVHHDAYKPPRDGNAVRLSLDLMIQSIAEEELAQTCKEYSAKGGRLIMMEPVTGQILAMANYPPFDPNQFQAYSAAQRRNHCVTDVYEPGSTFKPIVWSAALDRGAFSTDEMFDCTSAGVWVSPKGRRLRDVRGHGRLAAEMILVKSSNIGMAQIGLRLGPRSLYQAVRSFGLGRSTRTRLPGESSGIVNPRSQWSHYSVTSVPMGQEIAVTAVQLARAFSIIANGGLMVVPTIRLSPELPPELRPEVISIHEPVLAVKTANQTLDVLRRVVLEGTGVRAKSHRYPIAGKTGTAQVPDRVNGGYLEDSYVSSFVGIAPYDAPRMVALCVIDRPEKSKGYYGGVVAAPCVRRVIERTATYLGIEPLPAPDSGSSDTQLASSYGLFSSLSVNVTTAKTAKNVGSLTVQPSSRSHAAIP